MTLVEREPELAALGSLVCAGGIVLVEGGAGVGKTALAEAACSLGSEQGLVVLRSRAAELESGFGYGVVRQLLERSIVEASAPRRAELLAGPVGAAWALLVAPAQPADTSFAVVHGLYWLLADLAAEQRVLLVVDDAHWADRASLEWLCFVAVRIEDVPVSLLLTTRPIDPASDATALLTLRRLAATVLTPEVLSERGVAQVAGDALGAAATAELSTRLAMTSGGNPFYLRELIRALADTAGPATTVDWARAETRGALEVLAYLSVRLRRLGPEAMRLARAVAVLGDGCALRHAATLAGQRPDDALRAAVTLVHVEVLAEAEPPRFVHPIVRQAVAASLDDADRARLHRAAAEVLYRELAPPGRVAGHLRELTPAEDPWVCEVLRDAASAATAAGAPHDAVRLLRRAWAEPPPPAARVAVLRELARAEVTAGSATASDSLDKALTLAQDPGERARIAIEVARAHAAMFCWVDAVDAIERAVLELGATDPALTDRLSAEIVVAGLHDARRAARVAPALRRLAGRPVQPGTGEALAVARGMTALLTGRPYPEVVAPLLAAVADGAAPVDNWDTRAALLWCLITTDQFEAVEQALDRLHDELNRTGNARGLIAEYSSLGFLNLRTGALPEAESAARIAQRVIEAGDFAAGLPFAVTVRAEVAVEAGDLDGARALLDLLPSDGPAGVGTVLVPAAWGRLHLAAGRPADALTAFQRCAAMFSADVWGLELRDVGYLHARSGAALALLRLGARDDARDLVDAELADVRAFGAPRALGVALRAAGLAHGGVHGLELLADSVAALAGSPAVLERAMSFAELGAAQRRAGRRVAARDNLAEALDLAARCGATALADRVRDELRAAGGRPRRTWRRGTQALTPSELRVARLAADARTNREIAQTLY
ncbi:MAG TPA: AAA family ATPase, partial [Jatrophihabitantaceae bacterium]